MITEKDIVVGSCYSDTTRYLIRRVTAVDRKNVIYEVWKKLPDRAVTDYHQEFRKRILDFCRIDMSEINCFINTEGKLEVL